MIVRSEDLERALRNRQPDDDLVIKDRGGETPALARQSDDDPGIPGELLKPLPESTIFGFPCVVAQPGALPMAKEIRFGDFREYCTYKWGKRR